MSSIDPVSRTTAPAVQSDNLLDQVQLANSVTRSSGHEEDNRKADQKQSALDGLSQLSTGLRQMGLGFAADFLDGLKSFLGGFLKLQSFSFGGLFGGLF